MIFKRRSKKSNKSKEFIRNESFEEFLTDEYMQNEYLVPADLNAKLKDIAKNLSQLDGFHGIVNVGGTANGSYEWRSKKKSNPSSDLDYYLIGTSDLDLEIASEIISASVAEVGLHVDGVLNGKNRANFLNVDDPNGIIDRGDGALLALPFQSYYGEDAAGIQQLIVETILKRKDFQDVWDTIASFHAQSLSLHHGTFTEEENLLIMNDYYPKKVEKFELPLLPQEMQIKLGKV